MKYSVMPIWNGQYSVQCSRFGIMKTAEDGPLGPKHVVLIAKTNVNEETNSCITDGKLYVNKIEYSNAIGCLNTRL
jgi:hypothetical protein